jgi:hypothetical protein
MKQQEPCMHNFAAEWLGSRVYCNTTEATKELRDMTLCVSQHAQTGGVISAFLEHIKTVGLEYKRTSALFDFAFGVGRLFERTFQSLHMKSYEERNFLLEVLRTARNSGAYNQAECETLDDLCKRLVTHYQVKT